MLLLNLVEMFFFFCIFGELLVNLYYCFFIVCVFVFLLEILLFEDNFVF